MTEETYSPDPIEALSKRGLRREHIVLRDGKPFVLYAGLLDLAHRVGLVGIQTELIQSPVGPHYTAIVHARASKLVPADGSTPDRIETYDGLGDANEANTNRVISVHQIRLAETRAKARALRDLTNVGVTALEELGGQVVDAPQSQSRVVRDAPEVPDHTEAPALPQSSGRFAPEGADEPVSAKQKWLILKLTNERGITIDPATWSTKASAKRVIDGLLKGATA
jgi:hypothetical protein